MSTDSWGTNMDRIQKLEAQLDIAREALHKYATGDVEEEIAQQALIDIGELEEDFDDE